MLILLHIYSLIWKHREGQDSDDRLSDTKPWAIFLGRFLSGNHDLYSPRLIQVVRSIVAAAFIIIVLLFYMFAIIILPIHENGLLPVKGYCTSNDLVDNPGMQKPVLNILAMSNSDTFGYSIDPSLTAYFQ